ncbi:MAG TPA: hypothetical protein VH969_20130 [Actinophytocola sp.]|uniref:NACHT domain-containing protein n=1 Tax=Actinophytocola sp. TaxID=1872138 RepID=UPI002F92011E
MDLELDEWNLLVAIGSLVVAILVAAVPPLRRQLKAWIVLLARLAGTDRRRYRRWFRDFHGTVQNVYRDRREDLSLRDTYVPLAAYRGLETDRISASDVLNHPDHSRLVILGDPGTGKSTLLKAFGTSLIATGRARDTTIVGNWTPVLVPLRHLARWLDRDRSQDITGFIEREIFRLAKVRQPAALLESILGSRGMVLLLDGLDEVPEVMRSAVRSAVLEFVTEHRVRVVLTCRQQNFLSLRFEWVPALTDRTYTLARLTDDEIRAFIARRQGDFDEARTPTDLLASIVSSGTLELHRIPLILTVSIALYTRLPGYRIPTSLTDFYDEMIKQLVTRHDFRLEAAGSVNVFRGDDKMRYLREFAYVAAARPGRFEDFALDELVAVADRMADRLPSLPRGQSEAFVIEIIERTGLLAQTSLDADYVFAHRSIQEFLIARKLLGDPRQGAEFLATRAEEDEWRQVAVFFAAFEHDHLESFLAELADRNLELAGRCLAVGSTANRDIVSNIVDALGDQVSASDPGVSTRALSALIGLANAALPWVRDLAVSALLTQLAVFRTNPAEFANLDRDSSTRLITALAETADPAALELVAMLTGMPSADSLSIIGPLWRLLARSETWRDERSSRKILTSLLRLCNAEDGLRELQAQPNLLPASVRVRDAYPFEYGLAADSNLPTLLATAWEHGVRPEGVNSYVDTLRDDWSVLSTLERDYRRRATFVKLFWPARLVVVASAVASIVLILLAVATGDWRALLIAPDATWLNLLYLVPVAASAGAAIVLAEVTGGAGTDNFLRFPPAITDSMPDDSPNLSGWHTRVSDLRRLRIANPAVRWSDDQFVVVGFDGRPFIELEAVWILPAISSILLLPVAAALRIALPAETMGIIGYLAICSVLAWTVFWLPATHSCCQGVKVPLRSRHPMIGLYDDPKCGHWLVPLRQHPPAGPRRS